MRIEVSDKEVRKISRQRWSIEDCSTRGKDGRYQRNEAHFRRIPVSRLVLLAVVKFARDFQIVVVSFCLDPMRVVRFSSLNCFVKGMILVYDYFLILVTFGF